MIRMAATATPNQMGPVKHEDGTRLGEGGGVELWWHAVVAVTCQRRGRGVVRVAVDVASDEAVSWDGDLVRESVAQQALRVT